MFNKIIEYGLYFLVFLLPFQTRWIIKAGQLNGGPWEYGTYGIYGTDILLITILVLYIFYRIVNIPNDKFPMTNDKNGQAICNDKTIWWFIGGLVLTSAVSVFFAGDKFLALYRFGWLALGLGLFWLVIGANYSKTKLIYAILSGAFLSAGLGIWQFLNQSAFASKWLGLALHRGADLGASVIEAVGTDGVGERWLRAYGTMDHPNIFGGMLAIVILLIVFLLMAKNLASKDKTPLYPPLSGGLNFGWLLLTFTAALFFSFSRSAWLALAAGLFVMIIFAMFSGNLKAQRSLAEIILVMGILLFILFGQYQNLITARLAGEARLEIKSNSERLASDREAWQIIKKNWLVGVGPGNYTLALSRELPGRESYFYQPAHNVFLLVWAETGIAGLLFFVGVIACLIIFNFQFSIFNQFSMNKFSKPSLKIENYKLKIRETDNTKNTMVNSSILIAIIVLMLFDHWLFSLHFGVSFFWLVIGLAAEDKRDKGEVNCFSMRPPLNLPLIKGENNANPPNPLC